MDDNDKSLAKVCSRPLRDKTEEEEWRQRIPTCNVNVLSQTNTVSSCALWQVSIAQHKKRSVKV